jgi:hypothetical protein
MFFNVLLCSLVFSCVLPRSPLLSAGLVGAVPVRGEILWLTAGQCQGRWFSIVCMCDVVGLTIAHFAGRSPSRFAQDFDRHGQRKEERYDSSSRSIHTPPAASPKPNPSSCRRPLRATAIARRPTWQGPRPRPPSNAITKRTVRRFSRPLRVTKIRTIFTAFTSS